MDIRDEQVEDCLTAAAPTKMKMTTIKELLNCLKIF